MSKKNTIEFQELLDLQECETEKELTAWLKKNSKDKLIQVMIQWHREDIARIKYLKEKFPYWKKIVIHPYNLDDFPKSLPMKWTKPFLSKLSLSQLKSEYFERERKQDEFNEAIGFWVAMVRQHEFAEYHLKEKLKEIGGYATGVLVLAFALALGYFAGP